VTHAHHHDEPHGRGHEFAHGHDRLGASTSNAAFLVGAGLNVAFIVVEVAYGFIGNSLALLADAGHNLGDVLGILVAWGAIHLARRRPTPRFTYGLRGSSILAALFNAIVLLIAVGGIGVEAVQRLLAPQPVAGITVMAVAAIGIVVNGASALLFRRASAEDLNIRAVFLHLLTDAVVSVGVVLGGAGIVLLGWSWIDPAISLLVALFLIASTWRLLRQSIAMALQAVPHDLEPEAVREHLMRQPGVARVHDLHIWPMSTTERALTCHLVMPAGHPGDRAIATISDELNARFRIGHVTIQVETGDPDALCKLVPDHVV